MTMCAPVSDCLPQAHLIEMIQFMKVSCFCRSSSLVSSTFRGGVAGLCACSMLSASLESGRQGCCKVG